MRDVERYAKGGQRFFERDDGRRKFDKIDRDNGEPNARANGFYAYASRMTEKTTRLPKSSKTIHQQFHFI